MNLALSRRSFVRNLTLGAAALYVPGAFAEELFRTPAQTEGPFYPDKLPLDTDNDLLVVNDGITPAVGEITHLTGRVTDIKGNPLRNATVEIWQVCGKGVYLHTGDKREGRDQNFQGYGRFLTDSKGRYYFRTIKPVPYPGRTPHIHVAVSQKGKRVLTTQCYIKGEPLNEKDGIARSLKTPQERDALIIPFTPLKDSKIGELAAKFDLVLGLTPEDAAHPA